MFTDMCVLFHWKRLTARVLSLGGVDGGRSPEATEPRDRGKIAKKFLSDNSHPLIFFIFSVDRLFPIASPISLETSLHPCRCRSVSIPRLACGRSLL